MIPARSENIPHGGFAAIGDSDAGRLDGDPAHDRAVGPMQFLPGTWAVYGQDANGDGVRDPQNLPDAALAAGTYLCAAGGDVATPTGARTAVLAYNHSDAYADLVLGLAAAYTGAPVSTVAVVPVVGPLPGPLATPTLVPTLEPTAPRRARPRAPATARAPAPAPAPATARVPARPARPRRRPRP